MLSHVVLFWLKKDLSEGDRAKFAKAIATLTTVPSVTHGWCGQPASTDRPVVDRTYDWGLTVMFKGMAEHDAYQKDPVHLKFLDDCRALWSKVTIYDFE